jgi:hypothetical protein
LSEGFGHSIPLQIWYKTFFPENWLSSIFVQFVEYFYAIIVFSSVVYHKGGWQCVCCNLFIVLKPWSVQLSVWVSNFSVKNLVRDSMYWRDEFILISVYWKNKFILISMYWKDKFILISMYWKDKFSLISEIKVYMVGLELEPILILVILFCCGKAFLLSIEFPHNIMLYSIVARKYAKWF